ncbi:MAG: response regulator [Cellvibrio sp.]
MNNSPLTRDQQDLVELLIQELNAQLDYSLGQPERMDDGPQALSDQCASVAHFAEAAELIGLEGLAEACRFMEENFRALMQQPESIDEEQRLLVDSWAVYFLDYLQHLGEGDIPPASVLGVLEFLSNTSWPQPLAETQQQKLGAKLMHADIPVAEDPARLLPTTATMDLLSLQLSDEINQELFEGLMLELPGQVNSFTEQISRFVGTLDKQALASAQRIAHTIKGSGNVVGVTGLANFMHFTEDLLEEISRQSDEPSEALKLLLVDVSDTLAAMLDCLVEGASVGELELQVMQQVLDAYHFIYQNNISSFGIKIPDIEALVNAAFVDAESDDVAAPAAEPETVHTAQASTDNQHLQEVMASQLRIREDIAQDLLRLAGSSAIGTNRLQTQVHGIKQQLAHIGQLHHKLTSLTEELGQLIEVRELFSRRFKSSHDDGLDPLELDRYNELHSFFHQLQEFITDARDAIHQTQGELRGLEEQAYEQQVINRESQNLLLEMRMVPAHTMEARFQRCVRQACRLTGKAARLQLSGGDTMIDSRVLHELVDPLMHLLRNAVDHGIEVPAQRQMMGKPTEGLITLHFRTQGQSVLVQVCDDGAGLNHTRIAAKAEALNIAIPSAVQDEQHPEVYERWLHQLIFVPGFSTSEAVSQTSGRGIGLDMVADRIAALKGRITVESFPGEACEFTIRLPMTMIAEHGLLIKNGPHRLVVASRGVEQLLFLESAVLKSNGEGLQYQFEDELIDVYHIAQLANLPDVTAISTADAHALLVVESFPGQRVGVLIESVSASREMVIKPLSPLTPTVPGVIGATILGDGEVAPVIDVQQLVLDLLQSGLNNTIWQLTREAMRHQPVTQRPLALVVDDSLSTRRSLAQFVSDIGMDVCTAKDGFEAVDILQGQTPSVILVDMEMPRMNGLELTAHVRANDATRHIPVIMITSRNTEKHRSLAKAAGVDTYLNKPFSEDELLHCLKSSITA